MIHYGPFVVAKVVDEPHGEVVLYDAEGRKVDLASLFPFGMGFGESSIDRILDVVESLAEGAITLTLVPVSDLLVPGMKDRRGIRFTGQAEHIDICRQAAKWCEDQGYEWDGACDYPGGISDVTAPVELVAFECGTTQAHKIIDACAAGWRIMLLPYTSALEAVGVNSPETVGFLFAPTGKPFTVVARLKTAMRAAMETIG